MAISITHQNFQSAVSSLENINKIVKAGKTSYEAVDLKLTQIKEELQNLPSSPQQRATLLTSLIQQLNDLGIDESTLQKQNYALGEQGILLNENLATMMIAANKAFDTYEETRELLTKASSCNQKMRSYVSHYASEGLTKAQSFVPYIKYVGAAALMGAVSYFAANQG